MIIRTLIHTAYNKTRNRYLLVTDTAGVQVVILFTISLFRIAGFITWSDMKSYKCEDNVSCVDFTSNNWIHRSFERISNFKRLTKLEL